MSTYPILLSGTILGYSRSHGRLGCIQAIVLCCRPHLEVAASKTCNINSHYYCNKMLVACLIINIIIKKNCWAIHILMVEDFKGTVLGALKQLHLEVALTFRGSTNKHLQN